MRKFEARPRTIAPYIAGRRRVAPNDRDPKPRGRFRVVDRRQHKAGSIDPSSRAVRQAAGWTDFTLPLVSTMQLNFRPPASRSTL
jgi:hypothetical protein